MKAPSVYNIKLIAITIGGNLLRLLLSSFLDLMILSFVIIIIIRITHRCCFQTRYQLLGRIKYSIGLLRANDATLRFFVLCQRTLLAEVMFASARKQSRIISTISMVNRGFTYLVTTGLTKLSLQMWHLKGNDSSSECISYLWSSPSESASPRRSVSWSISNCQPAL